MNAAILLAWMALHEVIKSAKNYLGNQLSSFYYSALALPGFIIPDCNGNEVFTKNIIYS
jgi:hypothetical protein